MSILTISAVLRNFLVSLNPRSDIRMFLEAYGLINYQLSAISCSKVMIFRLLCIKLNADYCTPLGVSI
jgi:hypothetical protein